jgi:serine/threonine-protein kinase
MLARSAAIKLIHLDRLDPRPEVRRVAIERFHREARAIAALESTHTVRLFDFGATNDGTLYYVMELLDGVDLAELVKRHGPMPAERVRAILLQICDSLGEAHEMGLVHRDVKPANVILCRLGRTWDFVKVLDFGIVALQSDAAEEKPDDLTGAGTVVGSPGFMAPEALAGEPCDARSDIYSIGCVAYWLLTGRKVFEVSNRALEVAAVMRDPVIPPSALGFAVPRDLEDVVLACLAKLPEDRPASVDELAERLAGCVDREAWDSQRARAWWERHGASLDGARPTESTRTSPLQVVTRLPDPTPAGPEPVPGPSTATWVRRAEPGEAPGMVPTRRSRSGRTRF